VRRATLGLHLHQPQGQVADDEDARREDRPVSAESLSCHGIRGRHAGARDEHRLVGSERIGGHGPHDLGVARLIECRELVGRQRMERDDRFPGLGDSSDHNLALRYLGKHPPPNGERLGQQTARAAPTRLAMQEGRQCPQYKDPSYYGRALDVELAGHREGRRCRRTHTNVVAFIHLWKRDELVKIGL
jgi:hypothetical protein